MGVLWFLLTIVVMQVLARSSDIDYNRFTADVYKQLKNTKAGNFAVSPISIQIVLALAHQAAEGQTAHELSAALHLPEDKYKIQEIFRKLTSDLQEDGRYYLASANKVYVTKACKFTDFFKETAVNNFNSETDTIDFLDPGSVQKINTWIERKTDETIKNLVSEYDFGVTTKSVFINALSFKGTWQQGFDDMTYTRQFYIDSLTKIDVEIMQVDGRFNFLDSKELNAKVLELPFEGYDATMTFVLPNEKDGLNILENNIINTFTLPKKSISNITYDAFGNEFDNSKRRILVQIPKFTVDTSIELKEILQRLGVRRAFTNQAEFPYFVEDKSLPIDKLLQKTFLDVHEKGVTATAATKLIFRDLTRPGNTFFADHPFLYFIKVKGIVLFVGRFVSP